MRMAIVCSICSLFHCHKYQERRYARLNRRVVFFRSMHCVSDSVHSSETSMKRCPSSGMGTYSAGPCIRSKLQRMARGASRKFRYMESDLYNLVPAIGEINGLRSNYSFAMIPGEKREFGTCDMEIENRKAEPRPEVTGNIARIYFYMNWAYPGHGIISKKNQNLFDAWDKEDPVDDWECERSKRIEGSQRNENPFVKKVCVEVGKW